MAKHTPGPWVVNDIGDVRTGDGQDRFIASVFGRGLEEKTANARLIAAAPRMEETLEAIKAFALPGNTEIHRLCDNALALTKETEADRA